MRIILKGLPKSIKKEGICEFVRNVRVFGFLRPTIYSCEVIEQMDEITKIPTYYAIIDVSDSYISYFYMRNLNDARLHHLKIVAEEYIVRAHDSRLPDDQRRHKMTTTVISKSVLQAKR